MATSLPNRVLRAPAVIGSGIASLGLALTIVTSEPLWSGVAMGLIGAVVFLSAARQILLVIAFVAVILSSSNLGEVTSGLFYVRFATYAGLIALVWITGHRQATTFQQRSFFAALAAIASLALTSTIWSISPMVTLQRSIGMTLLAMTVVSLSWRCWKDERTVRSDFQGLAVVATVVMCGNLILFLLNEPWAFSGSQLRGILQNPNTVGLLVALTLPIELSLVSTSSGIKKLGWSLGVVVSGTGLLLSQSRGGIVAASVGAAGYMLFRRSPSGRRQLLALVTVVLAASSLLLLIPALQPGPVRDVVARFEGTGEVAGGSGRTTAWRLAAEIWRQRPLTGWGFGTTEFTFGVRSLEIQEVFTGLHPHNALLETLLEIGPLGLGALLVALLVPCMGARPRSLSDFHAGLTGAFFAGLTLMFVESGLTSAGSIKAFLFWLVAAALVRLRRDTFQGLDGR